nr:MAG: replication associated protein [Cressdnaviricota sp.]
MQDTRRLRNCCFTSYEDIDHKEIWEVYGESTIRYLVLQKEECPETKNIHLQGYVEFKKQMVFSKIKEIFNQTMHIEIRRGSAKQAADYCKKVETRKEGPWEYGVISNPGQRNDILKVVEAIQKDGKNYRDIAEEFPVEFVKFNRGFKELINVKRPIDRRPVSIWLWTGAPGIGKTRWSMETFPDAYRAGDTKEGWFDGYVDEDVIVFDEFNGQVPLQLMLKLMDGQPMKMPTKGGFVNIYAKTIVFLSNIDWNYWYSNEIGVNAAFARRLAEFCESKMQYYCDQNGLVPIVYM